MSITKERLRDIDLANDSGKPVGAFTLELADARTGRVRQRVRKNNYITPVYERFVRWQQGAMFHAGQPIVSESVVDNNWIGTLKDLSQPPHICHEAMVGLSSSIAADTDSDWATGRTVGYGFRWRSASVLATGKRGQLNDTQCLVTPDTVRCVWDFNENQGNGSYFSLAIARLLQNGDLACMNGFPRRAFNPATIAWPTTPSQYFPHIAGMDATNVYVAYGVSAGSGMRIVELPIAGFTDDSAFTDGNRLDYAGAAPTEVTLTGQTYTTTTTSGNLRHYSGTPTAVAKEGTGYIVAYQCGQNGLYIARFNSAGTRTHVLTLDATFSSLTSSLVGVAIVGTDAYVVSNFVFGTGGRNDNIYKVDLSTFTLDSLLPLDGGATTSGGITAIGTDIFVYTSEGIHRYDTTDGSLVELYGHPNYPAFSEQGLAPFNTATSPNQYGLEGMGARDAIWNYHGHQTASTNSSMFSGFYGQTLYPNNTPLLIGDGTKLWISSWNFPAADGTTIRQIAPLIGGNAFSRSVLESEVGKSTSSTMKWTYELTLPASWYANPTHPAPPSPA